MKKEGQYFIYLTFPDDVDRHSFQLRQEGYDIRNVIRIEYADRTWMGLLVRGSMSETVLEAYVRRGTGVVDINGGRIDVGPAGKADAGGGKLWSHYRDDNKDEADPQRYQDDKGRFPTNFVLAHHSECECVGTKKVKSGKAGSKSHHIGQSDVCYGDMDEHEANNSSTYASEDVLEEVPEWDCQATCPVRLLDQQSGILHSQDPETRKKGQNSTETHAVGFGTKTESAYGDEGGASRFFYQAVSSDDLTSYLTSLTGKEPLYTDDE